MTKILLVEDDVFLVKVYKLKLEKAGYDVTILEDGSQVVEVATDIHPDLVVLDILLPIKDGFEVLGELKKNPKTVSIPVLVLSALQMDKDIEKGKALGASEYLAKTNVTFEEVMATIKDLVA